MLIRVGLFRAGTPAGMAQPGLPFPFQPLPGQDREFFLCV